MNTITREQLRGLGIEVVEDATPERPSIFEHEGRWFKRSGEMNPTLPAGEYVWNGMYGVQVVNGMAGIRWEGDAERLIPLPPIEVGQRWRLKLGVVTIMIMAGRDDGGGYNWAFTDTPEHTGGWTYCSAEYLYSHGTLILTCPACGAETDEPQQCGCRQVPRMPGGRLYHGVVYEASEYRLVKHHEVAWDSRVGMFCASQDFKCQPDDDGMRWIMVPKQPATPPPPPDWHDLATKLAEACRKMRMWADNPATRPAIGHSCGPEGNCDCDCMAWGHYQQDLVAAQKALTAYDAAMKGAEDGK